MRLLLRGADGETGAAVAVEIALFPEGATEPPGCGRPDTVGFVAGIASMDFGKSGVVPAFPTWASTRSRTGAGARSEVDRPRAAVTADRALKRGAAPSIEPGRSATLPEKPIRQS